MAFDSRDAARAVAAGAEPGARISSDISRLVAGGGYATLAAAAGGVSAACLGARQDQTRHLADRRSGGIPGIIDLVDQMVASKITGVHGRRWLRRPIRRFSRRSPSTATAFLLPRTPTRSQDLHQRDDAGRALGACWRSRCGRRCKNMSNYSTASASKGAAAAGYVADQAQTLAEVILVLARAEPLLARWRQAWGRRWRLPAT